MTDKAVVHDGTGSMSAQREARELRCWPEYFEEVVQGRKTFEVRKREPTSADVFLTGQLLWLREHSFADGYTGREVVVRITYVCPLDAIGCAGFDGMTIELVGTVPQDA